MIQPNELRAGNYILGQPISIPRMGVYSNGVTQITAYGIYCIESGVFSKYDPIPLTREILLACRLSKRFHKSYQIKPLSGEKLTGKWGLFINGRWEATKIEYLHQLQNLYFSLTGTELIYQPIK